MRAVRFPAVASVQELSALAAHLRAPELVLHARPVGYASPEALAARDPTQRYVLTDGILARLHPADDPRQWADAWTLELAQASPVIRDVYLFAAPDELSAVTLAREIQRSAGALVAEPLLIEPIQPRFLPDDPLFPDQWHLRNIGQGGGQPGEDVNIESAWDLTLGLGVVIGIVDDGLEAAHPDLAPNYDAALSFDFNGNDPDPTPPCHQSHGTAVTGLAGARGNNAIGVSGAAPESAVAGLRILGGQLTDAIEAAALSYRSDAIGIYSNSWGPVDNGLAKVGPGVATAAALADGAATGRGGLGSVFVWAGGNGGTNGDNANYDGYVNSRYTIGVTASDNFGVHPAYAEPGACLLVNVPSSGGTLDMTTTDLTGACGASPGDYRSNFTKTSAATPVASGVVALMLAANPSLTWRDVQHILVQTADMNDPTDPGWTANAAGRMFHHNYGFGRIDALAAVQAGQSWTTVGPELSAETSVAPGLAVPDNDPVGVESQVTITQAIRIESVEVPVSISTLSRGDLRIELVSPGGSVSVLADLHGDTGDNYNWTFTSVQHWDEISTGTWTLRLIDLRANNVATLNNWTLRIFGTSACPALLGDYDGDCAVNLADFATFALCFGHPVSSPPPDCSPVEAEFSDFDNNGLINLADFATFALYFGT